MKRMAGIFFVMLLLTTQAYAENEQQPETIAGRMATKLGRGITNVLTAPIEIPKQTGIIVTERGGVGLFVGPMTGVIMATYRALLGLSESVLFMVPAPGYYDATVDPEFVWDEWETKQEKKERLDKDLD